MYTLDKYEKQNKINKRDEINLQYTISESQHYGF